MQATTSESSTVASTVEVKLIVDGYVHDGLVRKRGESIAVTEAEAAQLRLRRFVQILPLMRCLALPCSIGGRALAVGETAYAPTLELARAWYRSGRADVINLDELGLTRASLPLRVGERAHATQEMLTVRALKYLHLSGLMQPNIPQDMELELPRDRAEAVVRAGLAEPVGGWTPRPLKQVLVKATRDNARIGDRYCRSGEITAVDEETANRAFGGRVAGSVTEPVRIRALKPDGCCVGGRTLAPGDIAEVHPEIAEDLITEGLAELTTDPVTHPASSGPKRARPVRETALQPA